MQLTLWSSNPAPLLPWNHIREQTQLCESPAASPPSKQQLGCSGVGAGVTQGTWAVPNPSQSCPGAGSSRSCSAEPGLGACGCSGFPARCRMEPHSFAMHVTGW